MVKMAGAPLRAQHAVLLWYLADKQCTSLWVRLQIKHLADLVRRLLVCTLLVPTRELYVLLHGTELDWKL